MTYVDQYGVEFTTDSAAAADAYVEALDLSLTNQVGGRERLLLALDLDPRFALARALLAFQLQFDHDAALPVAQIVMAAQHATRATRREQQVVDALRRALVGDTLTARRMIGSHLREFPRDALMIREYVLLRSYGGGTGRKASVAASLRRLAPHMGSDPWFLGVYSLALSEVGEVGLAVRLAEAGLDARPDHGVVAHALAHTSFETGDDIGGRDFLREWLANHGDSAVNAGHLTWHLALTQLALSEPTLALEVYHRQKTVNRAQSFTLEDAVSLLWRLQLRGVDVGTEWATVVDQQPSASPRRAFQLAHIAFAMAARRNEDGLQHLTEQVAREVTARPEQPLRFLPPLLDALRLVALDRWVDAAPALTGAAAPARRLGGSNEQHTLLDETVAVAWQRAGEAAAFTDQRA